MGFGGGYAESRWVGMNVRKFGLVADASGRTPLILSHRQSRINARSILN